MSEFKTWFIAHATELFRGTALGMALIAVFFFIGWKSPPRPRIGELENTVIMQYGRPDNIIRTEQSPTEEKHFPFRYLLYRNGFFKSSVTVITIDGVTGRVLNVTQDGNKGY